MRKLRIHNSWAVVALALGMVAFGAGCSEDDGDNGTGPEEDPYMPELVGPADGTTATLSADNRFELEWSGVDSAVAYHVQVAGDESFGGTSVINDEPEFEGTTYDVQLTRIRFGATYYWRVASVLSDGSESDYSDVRSFTLNAPDAGDYMVLSGEITEDMTLDAGTEYLLRGGVFVGKDDASISVTLTIPAGTKLYGEKATDGMLVIRRGSMIDAQGTASAPIVFTSDQPVGSRARGDWGGVILNGQATLNTGATAEGEGSTGTYGGTDDADNSGTMRYVRIEFAGREISPDNELNGLACQGVGSATTLEYIQIHMNEDDGIEFFGGTANAKYIYVTGCADDQFDGTDGWRGKGQFWIAQQFTDDGDQGIEWDNSGDNNTATPYTNPTVYNFTLVGSQDADIGMLLREGLKTTLRNGIVVNFGESGIDVDHSQTFTNVENGDLTVDYCYFYGNAAVGEDDDDGFDETVFVEDTMQNNTFTDPGLVDPYNYSTPDFSTSSTLTGTTPPDDGFFDQVDFIGGMGDVNWLAGWTTQAMN